MSVAGAFGSWAWATVPLPPLPPGTGAALRAATAARLLPVGRRPGAVRGPAGRARGALGRGHRQFVVRRPLAGIVGRRVGGIGGGCLRGRRRGGRRGAARPGRLGRLGSGARYGAGRRTGRRAGPAGLLLRGLRALRGPSARLTPPDLD